MSVSTGIYEGLQAHELAALPTWKQLEEETILIDNVNYNTIAKVLNEDLLNEVYKARKSADAVYKNAEAQKAFCEKYSKQFAEFLKNEYNAP